MSCMPFILSKINLLRALCIVYYLIIFVRVFVHSCKPYFWIGMAANNDVNWARSALAQDCVDII